MEEEISQVNHSVPPQKETETSTSRPFSPVQCINSGILDGRPINASSPMESLLISYFKLLKAATKDDLSSRDRKKIQALADSYSVNDIRNACADISNRSVNAIATMPDITIKRVLPPVIQDNAINRISSVVSKDYQCRTNGQTFGDSKHHSIRIKDILEHVKELCEAYNLGEKPCLSLIRRSLKEPSRTFFDNLTDAQVTFPRIWQILQEHYSFKMDPGTASKKLVSLLERPIESLDSFLTELLNLAISAQNSLPVSLQSKYGHLYAVTHLLEYLQRMYPHVLATISHDLAKLKAIQTNMEPSEMYLALMRILQMHRSSLETPPPRRNHHRVHEISCDNDYPPQGESVNHAMTEQITSTIANKVEELFTKKLDNLQNSLQMNGLSNQNDQNCYVQDVNSRPWAPNMNQLMNQNRPGMQNNNNQWRFANNNSGNNYANPNMQAVGFRQNRPSNSNQGPRFTQTSGNSNNNLSGKRAVLPPDIYAKHFAGNKCFKCGLPNHVYRQCPNIQSFKLHNATCPTCQSAGIFAYHENCNGRITNLHKNPNNSAPQAKISEIITDNQCIDSQGNEGESTYQSFPQYCNQQWPANE
jgi:hypothetical protein